MREIKFRAWDTRTKQMYWWAIPETPDGHITTHEFLRGNVDIMQYTGLKDKNGKEIYEGDIISQDVNYQNEYNEDYVNTIRARIEYHPGAFWLQGIDDCVTDCNWHFYNENQREVIGNIYENKELLK